MTAVQSTRRVYSAEELHRLRSTASQARLKDLLEDKDEDDAALVKGTRRHYCTDSTTDIICHLSTSLAPTHYAHRFTSSRALCCRPFILHNHTWL